MIRKGQYDLVTEIGDVIANSSQNMSNLMKDLLDYTKANVYGKSLALEDVNLRKLTATKYEIFKNVIEQKNNRFVNEIPETVTVHTDLQLLAIIIHNLIDNATKFTRDGLIRVKAEQNEEGLRLTVTNNGTPMPPEIVNLFNQENYRSATGTVSGRNTGLGLLIVREIAALIRVPIRVSQTDTTDFELYFS
jgi:signal transduction histidine kinase